MMLKSFENDATNIKKCCYNHPKVMLQSIYKYAKMGAKRGSKNGTKSPLDDFGPTFGARGREKGGSKIV